MRTGKAGKVLRRVLSASMALALFLTLGVDGLLVSRHIDHERKLAAIRAERKAERHYLQQLQSVALDVGHAAAPVATILVALGEYAPGDLYAARDALARGNAASLLKSVETQLSAIRAPQPLRALAKQMSHDVEMMRTAALDLGSHVSTTNYEQLSTALNGDSSSAFEDAAGDFASTLSEAFSRQHLTPPFNAIGPGPLDGGSATDWIFGADRACVGADNALAAGDKYLNSDSLPALEALTRVWIRALSGVATAFERLRQPQGSAVLPSAIRDRLGVLRAGQRAFQAELNAVLNHDADGVIAAFDRVDALTPALGQLSKAMRSYGAAVCGDVMDEWAGVKHPHSPVATSI